MSRIRGGRDAGTAVVEFVWLAVLLLVPLTYLVIGAFRVQAAVLGASTAAREAGRAYVLAGGDNSDRRTAAAGAALEALSDQHVEPASLPADGSWLVINRNAYPGKPPTLIVHVDVRFRVSLPFLAGWAAKAGSVTVTAHHDTALDTYAEAP